MPEKILFIGGPLQGTMQEVWDVGRPVQAPDIQSERANWWEQPESAVIGVVSYRPCALQWKDRTRIVYVMSGIPDADVWERVREWLVYRFMAGES